MSMREMEQDWVFFPTQPKKKNPPPTNRSPKKTPPQKNPPTPLAPKHPTPSPPTLGPAHHPIPQTRFHKNKPQMCLLTIRSAKKGGKGRLEHSSTSALRWSGGRGKKGGNEIASFWRRERTSRQDLFGT